MIPDADAVDAPGKPITPNSMCHTLIIMELLLPQGETWQLACVIGHLLNKEGQNIGQYDENLTLNTAIYGFEFPDGTTNE